jgi:hypothetical protein
VVTAYGLCLLLEGLLPTYYVLVAFQFPYVLITSFVFTAINFFFLPSFGSISADYRKGENYTSLLLYVAMTMLLLVYAMLGGSTQ